MRLAGTAGRRGGGLRRLPPALWLAVLGAALVLSSPARAQSLPPADRAQPPLADPMRSAPFDLAQADVIQSDVAQSDVAQSGAPRPPPPRAALPRPSPAQPDAVPSGAAQAPPAREPAPLLTGPGIALPLPPEARLSAERQERFGSAELPTGPFADGAVPLRRVEGAVNRRAWRIARPDLTTLDILAPVRAAALAAGHAILLDCEAAGCGGFDFRYGVEVLPEPAMHVDLGNYRFLSTLREGPAGPEALTLMVSGDASGLFVQTVAVTAAARPAEQGGLSADATARPAPGEGMAPPAPEAPARPAPTETPGRPAPAQTPASGAIGAALEAAGFAVLEGLAFASGGADLAPGDPAVAGLAAWLAANPGVRITLVGHTDASGAPAANLALSRRRAEAVRRRLIADHGIAPGRIGAEGVGSLSPRATNLTPEGRDANRRVEALRDLP